MTLAKESVFQLILNPVLPCLKSMDLKQQNLLLELNLLVCTCSFETRKNGLWFHSIKVHYLLKQQHI